MKKSSDMKQNVPLGRRPSVTFEDLDDPSEDDEKIDKSKFGFASDDEESEDDEKYVEDEPEDMGEEEMAALLEEIAKDPPKADEGWKKNIKPMDDLLKKRHGNVVKLSWHPVKGRILLARQAFKTGQLILSDRALVMVQRPYDGENKLWDKLVSVCSEKELPLDPLWYWIALTTSCPDLEQRTPIPSRRPSMQSMSGQRTPKEPSTPKTPKTREPGTPKSPKSDASRKWSISSDAPTHTSSSSSIDLEGANDGAVWLTPYSKAVTKRLKFLYSPEITEPSLEVMIIIHELNLHGSFDAVQVEEDLQRAVQNCFQCHDEEEREGLAMWFTPSFVSHSCIPNAAGVVSNDGMFSLVAQRPIRPGDEIAISYISEDDLRFNASYRRTVLAKTRRFVCQCQRCAGNDAIKPASCFVCGQILLYMQTGEELRKQSLCKRIVSQSLINTYVCSHVFFCALNGGNM